MKNFFYLNLIVILFFFQLMAGCIHLDTVNRQNIDKIVVGQDEDDLRKLMGSADFSLRTKDGKTIYFYGVKQKNSQIGLSMDNCMPVLIENNRVVSIGSDFLENWDFDIISHVAQANQQKENLKKEVLQGELEKKNAELVALKIKKLEAKVRPIPSSNYGLNLKYYKELLSLVPDSDRYQKKVNYYQLKMDAQEQTNEILQEDLDDEPSSGDSGLNGELIKSENIRLYKGNNNIELALRELSGGNLYVWVKNISPEPIALEAGNYHLLDQTRETIPCSPSIGLIKELPAGQIASGHLKYKGSEDVQLGEIVFEHPRAGKIIRVFP
ncbi:MAG: DUF3192 domain-containing protein [Desulfobacula sp.]|nr:DUF3192 domain-containing protein [Desulfobacula sp.]